MQSWHAAWACLGILLHLLVCSGRAQNVADGRDQPASRELSANGGASVSSKNPAQPHAFWDRTNTLLFAGVGAFRGLDYASTRNMRARGRDEILLTNAIVDNKPLFAGIEAAGTAASVGVSYLFHRYGHHKLERWVSIAHISVAGGGGAIHNYSLKTAHPQPNPP